MRTIGAAGDAPIWFLAGLTAVTVSWDEAGRQSMSAHAKVMMNGMPQFYTGSAASASEPARSSRSILTAASPTGSERPRRA